MSALHRRRAIAWVLAAATCGAVLSSDAIEWRRVFGVSLSAPALRAAERETELFLERALQADEATLACFANGKQVDRLHGSGRVFAYYFVARAIGGVLPQPLRDRIVGRLRNLRRDGLWAYGPSAPVDSDDTAFALHALMHLGVALAHDDMAPLDRFRAPGRSVFRTFLEGGSSDLRLAPSAVANLAAHPEVNANLAFLSQRAKQPSPIDLDAVLAFAGVAHGSAHSYFYPSPDYALLFFVPLLESQNRQELVRGLIDDVRRRQNADGSWGHSGDAFDTALALNALADAHVIDGAYERGLRNLLIHQRHDGRFHSDAVVWQYVAQDAPRVVWRAYDHFGVVTSSLALSAVRAYLERVGHAFTAG